MTRVLVLCAVLSCGCASASLRDTINTASQINKAMATSGRAAFLFHCRKVADQCHQEGDLACPPLVKCQEQLTGFVELCSAAEQALTLAQLALEFHELDKAELYANSARATLSKLNAILQGVME